jgi:UDP-2,3-diacylglucosamine hydrolase
MLAWVMLRAVLADLHLGHAPGDLEALASSLAEVRASGAEEVVFLGDVCVALVGFARYWDSTVQQALDLILELRHAGIRVVLVEGNRDFYLDTPALARFFDQTTAAHSFSVAGRRFLLEHGDLINRHDHAYLFWRSISKSQLARTWARLLPTRLARRIVHRTEARLAQTNFTHRLDLPTTSLTTAARRHFPSGVDVVLWGHFHRPWSFFEGSHEAHVIAGWLDGGTTVWIDEHGRLAETPRSGQPSR